MISSSLLIKFPVYLISSSLLTLNNFKDDIVRIEPYRGDSMISSRSGFQVLCTVNAIHGQAVVLTDRYLNKYISGQRDLARIPSRDQYFTSFPARRWRHKQCFTFCVYPYRRKNDISLFYRMFCAS